MPRLVEAFDDQSPPCPACAGTDFLRRFEKKGRQFWRCRSCGLERQQPLPSASSLADYYYQSYREGMYQIFAAAERMKQLTAAARLQQLRAVPLHGEWLDVGCATGVFLDELRRHGISARGVEISQTAVDIAKSRGLNVKCGTLADIEETAKFDVITSFDVLEHVLDPLDFVMLAAARLKPGGVLAMSTPNLNSLSRRVMRRRWYFYIPEEHLHYFTPATLEALNARAGLERVHVRASYKPLTWDYSLSQFQEYNPWIHKCLSLPSRCLPRRLRNAVVPLYIGEMMSVAFKPRQSDAAK